ncbi:MAG: hypothetical protein ABIK65_10665 [Candidatus Eisenbacteria bacterium]
MTRQETTPVHAELLDHRVVHELPGDWDSGDLRALLEMMEVDPGDTSDEDLGGLVEMALADLDTDEAGDFVLRRVFGDSMTAGVRQNVVSDLEGDAPWEDFADIGRHAGIFTAVGMMGRAFPTRYGKPEAVRALVRIRAAESIGAAPLAKGDPAFLLRVLAAGMQKTAMLRRLYGDALHGGAFPEAAPILWRIKVEPDGGDPSGRTFLARVHSSLSWIGPLEEAGTWDARIPVDVPKEGEYFPRGPRRGAGNPSG